MPEGLDKQIVLLSSWSERSSATNWNVKRARRARQANSLKLVPVIEWAILGQENFTIARQKLCSLVVLNKKFLTPLADSLTR